MAEQPQSRSFSLRYLIRGNLRLTTAMHIGGGRATLAPTDAPVVLTPEGLPFIPGSSFKGAFRSTVEKLAAAIPAVTTCGLLPDAQCPGAPDSSAQRDLNKRRSDWPRNETEQRLIAELLGSNGKAGTLCHTCRLFGSPYLASKVLFDDLYLTDSTAANVQIRDGVAIDRDSERARDQLKYDYEVVAAGATFCVALYLDEPTPTDRGLLCAGLAEYQAGFGQIGGKRSRGLGACIIEDLSILELNLAGGIDAKEKARRLKKYLLGRTPEQKMEPVPDPVAFIDSSIDQMLGAGA